MLWIFFTFYKQSNPLNISPSSSPDQLFFHNLVIVQFNLQGRNHFYKFPVPFSFSFDTAMTLSWHVFILQHIFLYDPSSRSWTTSIIASATNPVRLSAMSVLEGARQNWRFHSIEPKQAGQQNIQLVNVHHILGRSQSALAAVSDGRRIRKCEPCASGT